MRLTVRQGRKFDKKALPSSVGQADTVSSLYEKALQNETILRRYQQFELVLLDLVDFESLLNALLQNSVDYFQLDSVELWLFDPQNTLTELLPEEPSYPGRLRLLNRSRELDDLYLDEMSVSLIAKDDIEKYSLFPDIEIQSAAMLPLVRRGVLVGSLHFGAKGHKRFTADKSTDFITHLSSIVAACFENVVNLERLNRLSLYDVLTQVKNRRAFHQALDEEISRAGRNNDPLSLLFVDLDHFKHINDTYGHPMGDKVLNVVAQFINELLRKTDHVCRYGGEEFALVLPNCDKLLALEIAERIRVQVSELSIENEADVEELGSQVSITLSIGVSCWFPAKADVVCTEQEMAKILVECSDRGVYQAKSKGRNKVCYVSLTQHVGSFVSQENIDASL